MLTLFLAIFTLDGILNRVNGEHVHFKIHVPEYVNHHTHEKTVYIHVHDHKPKTKDVINTVIKEVPMTVMHHPTPSQHPKEHHHQDWSSWSFNSHDEHGEKYGHGQKHLKRVRGHNNDDPSQSFKDQYQIPKYIPFEGEDVSGYSYPPQYISEMKTEQIPKNNNIDGVRDEYEEGHREGLHTQSGHVYLDEYNKFDNNENELSNDESEGGQEDNPYIMTHAGRYFVNEDDIEDDRDDINKNDRAFSRAHIVS